MTIADELSRLAELRREGHITEQEFAEAKRQVLLQGNTGDQSNLAGKSDETGGDPLDVEERVYQSSRWTSGNFIFPDSLVLVNDGILFRKGSLLGSREEHIAYKAVASLRITNGIFFSTVSIETSGGSQPIVINGLWKSEAREIQDALREYQRQSQR